MKKRRYPLLPTLAVAALMLIPIRGAAQVFNPYSVSYTATYSNDNLTIGTDTLDGVVYSTVSYNDLYNDGEPGMPSLPVDFLKFSVPYNATDFTVSVNTRMWHTQTLDHLLYPCQMPRLLDGSPAPPAMLPDSAAYYSGNYYPSQMAWVVDEGFLAGENHIVTVAVLPFRYTHNASTNQLSMVRRCGITLRYRLSDSLAMQPIVRNDSLLREEGYNLVQTMVVNPNSVKSYAPTLNTSLIDSIGYMHGIGGGVINGGYAGGDGPGPVNPSLPDPGVDTTGIGTELYLVDFENVPYLIVTTPELKHSVRRIAALKRQEGYNVKIVTMEEVMNDSIACYGDFGISRDGIYELADSDSAAVLRQYLKKAFSCYNTKYLLLVGNLPFRYIYSGHPFNQSTIKSVPSDIYFSDLTGFWSSDLRKQLSDINPEIFVGRIMARDEQQVMNYTDKLLRYSINPGNGDYHYLQRIFYSEGHEMQQINSVSSVNSYYRRIFPDCITILENVDEQSPSGTDIVEAINNNQYGYLSFLNHAGPSGILLCGKRDNDSSTYNHFLWSIDSIHIVYNNLIDNSDPHTLNGINNLSNKLFPNICYSIGCSTMPFDKVPGYTDVDINFGESFTLGKDYGGPAFLGNTRDGTLYGAIDLETMFANQISSGNSIIGVAESFSKVKVSYDRYTCEVHNLMGDPALKVWTDEPEQFSNISITRDNNAISISGIDKNGITITTLSNNGRITKNLVSSDTTIVGISPNSSIMICKHNFIPYIAQLKLQNTNLNNSQYVLASEVIAGDHVDSIRTNGEVTVKSGVEYEIEASGTVTLEDGFNVEKGATFAIYPACF